MAAALGVALLIVAILYWPSLGYEYVYDDRLLFLVDRRLRDGWDSLPNIAMPVIGGTTYFRPAVLLSFVAEFAVMDGVPHISRSVNLLIHIGNSLLVGLLARRCVMLALRRSEVEFAYVAKLLVPAGAALAYGLHPSLVESAGWVSGRFDLMVTTFSLAALLCAIENDRVAHPWLIAAFVLFALLSKEMAITVPVLIWLYRSVVLESQPLQVRDLFRTERHLVFALSAAVVVYLAVRLAVHPTLLHTDASVVAAAGGNPLRYALVVGTTLLFYLRLFVYPYRDTVPMHPVDFNELMEMTPGSVPALIGIVLAVALPVVAWRLRSFSLWLFFGVLLSLAPVLNVIPLRLGSSIGENRFLTLPLALFVCALAYSAVRVWTVAGAYRRLLSFAVTLVAGFVLIGNAAFVHAILPMWRSDITLFASCFAQYPDNPRAAAMYLRATTHSGDRRAALAAVERSLAGKQVPTALLTPYATSLALEGHQDRAVQLFELAQMHKDENGLDDMNTISRYAEVRQAWFQAAQAEPLIARAKAIRAAKAAAGDDYLISHLEMRQALLLGALDRFAAGYAQLKAAVPPDMVLVSRAGMTTFRKAVCEHPSSGTGNRLCVDSVWSDVLR